MGLVNAAVSFPGSFFGAVAVGGLWVIQLVCSARLNGQLREAEARTDARFDRVDARFDRVDARFDKVDARLDRLESSVAELKEIMLETRVECLTKYAPRGDLEQVRLEVIRCSERLCAVEVRLDVYAGAVGLAGSGRSALAPEAG